MIHRVLFILCSFALKLCFGPTKKRRRELALTLNTSHRTVKKLMKTWETNSMLGCASQTSVQRAAKYFRTHTHNEKNPAQLPRSALRKRKMNPTFFIQDYNF